MPYLDLDKNHPHFKALQKIGATGILRGEGRNVGWANQTWFRADAPLLGEEIFAEGYYNGRLPFDKGPIKVGDFANMLRMMGVHLPARLEEWWSGLGLNDYDYDRNITRLEAAVIADATIDPFNMLGVDYNGNFYRY